MVDDEKHIRQFVKALLTTMHCEVVAEAENGAEAVTAYAATRPDFVLLDVNMPVKDGLAALREIKAADHSAIVIMLTSLSDMATIQSALESGASNYLRKDTPVTEMRRLLTETWRDHVEPGLKQRPHPGGHG